MRWARPYATWLHTNVPAVLDTAAGTPASRIAATHALIGSVEKYAAGPPGTTGSSTGAAPALSVMRASSTLTAIRSTVTPGRPPAWPTHTTRSGPLSRTARRRATTDSPKTQGSWTAVTVRPAGGSAATMDAACQDGFTLSPQKGSKPVMRTRVIFCRPS